MLPKLKIGFQVGPQINIHKRRKNTSQARNSKDKIGVYTELLVSNLNTANIYVLMSRFKISVGISFSFFNTWESFPVTFISIACCSPSPSQSLSLAQTVYQSAN